MKKTIAALCMWMAMTSTVIAHEEKEYCWTIGKDETVYCGTLKEEILSLLENAKNKRDIMDIFNLVNEEMENEEVDNGDGN